MNLELKHEHSIKQIWTNICRFALAGVFIFSGFVKANDPQGMYYKLEDYLLAFGLNSYIPELLPLFIALLLGVIEFTLGVFLFFGIRPKLTTLVLYGFMLFMTPFTLYLALSNPVADCGCFGDALILSNWETFWKNVLLLVAAFTLFKWKHLMIRIISKKSQWLVSYYTILYISAISLYCVTYLPIFDFRPYHIGANIPEKMSIPEGKQLSVIEHYFIYEKEGVRKRFTAENLPSDSTWTFVDSEVHEVEPGYVPPIESLTITLDATGEDITERILNDQSYTFLLIAPWLDKADDGYIDLINEIYDYSMENGYAFYCLTQSLPPVIERWNEQTGAAYPYCICDETTLKTMVRSNPGLLLLKEGTILNKWSCRSLPNEYELHAKLDELPLAQMESQSALKRFFIVLAWFAIPLLLFTMLDKTIVNRLGKK